jgi:HAD superfamily hydrolase (TIGR01509 family)
VAWDLVIFDCDGVLVDSEPVANRIFTESLQALGLKIDYEEVCRTFIGLSMARCLEIVERRLGRPVPRGFVDRLQTRTYEAFRAELRPVKGVARALERIDLPVCVASSGEQEKMRLTLGLTGLLDRFEGRLYSATEVERGKPHPDLFLHAARSLGADPVRCVVVEDSEPGVVAARAARMKALGYAARTDGRRLAAAGATVFHAMAELPEMLTGTERSGGEICPA